MAGRPATLEGSLLARKGDAAPAIPDDSPLMDSVEGATSDVVPLHRVENPGVQSAQAAVVPSAVHTASPISSRRRAVIILVGLLVLCLIAVALAFRGGSGPGPAAPAGSGATSAPAPERAMAVPPAVPAPVVEAPAAAAPSEAHAPPPVDAGGHAPPVPPAAAPPSAAAALQKPEPAKPAPATGSASGPYVLQFASIIGERRAQQEAVRLQKRLGAVLGGRTVAVVGTEVGGRMRYRLRAGGFQSLRTAISTCRKVARLKIECLPIRR